MSVLKEFKEFAIKGNVVDLAVGLIIGAEFGKIVNSLVNDVVMPPIGLLVGGVDFKNFFITLKEAATQPGPYATLAEAQKAGAALADRAKVTGHTEERTTADIYDRDVIEAHRRVAKLRREYRDGAGTEQRERPGTSVGINQSEQTTKVQRQLSRH